MTSSEQSRIPRIAQFVGWLLVIYGGLAVLGFAVGSGQNLSFYSQPGQTVSLILLVVNSLIFLAFLVAGIALLRSAPWARRAAVWALGIAIVYQLALIVQRFIIPYFRQSELSYVLPLIPRYLIGSLIILIAAAGYSLLLLALEMPTVSSAWHEPARDNTITRFASRLETRLADGRPVLYGVLAVLLIIFAIPVLLRSIPALWHIGSLMSSDTFPVLYLITNSVVSLFHGIGLVFIAAVLWWQPRWASSVSAVTLWIIIGAVVLASFGITKNIIFSGMPALARFWTTGGYLVGLAYTVLPLILIALFIKQKPEEAVDVTLKCSPEAS